MAVTVVSIASATMALPCSRLFGHQVVRTLAADPRASALRSRRKKSGPARTFLCAAATQVESEVQAAEVFTLLEDLSKSLVVLPPNFLETIPKDLQVDVKDAAFALSSGRVQEDCGDQVGDLLLKLAKAFEKSDTEAATEVGNAFTSMRSTLALRPALGRRLIKAGNYLKRTGQYGQGELQNMACRLIALGEAVGGKASDEPVVDSAKVLKFGSLQVKVTSRQAFTGALLALLFSIASWQLAVAVQSVPETSLNYASDNAFLLAASLRGALLALGYSCACLSAFSAVGLVALGIQVSNDKSK